MKYWVILVLMVGAVGGCKVPDKEPEFRRITNLTLDKISGKESLLTADAVFYNPNKVKIKLKQVNIDVNVDGKKIAQIDHDKKTLIQPLSEFVVPLDVKFDLKEVGTLKNILAILRGKDIEAEYKGFIKASVYGITYQVPVDYIGTVRF